MTVSLASSGHRLLSCSITSLGRVYSTTTTLPATANSRTRAADPSKDRPDSSQRPRAQSKTPRDHQTQRRWKGIADPPPANSGRSQRKSDKPPGLWVPPGGRPFLLPNGRLFTTPPNWQFLNETGIDFNNSNAGLLHLGPEQRRVTSNFACRVQYTPNYIMNPYHLKYLNPRDHPLSAAIRAKYRRKIEEEPLWLHMLSQSMHVGVVKSTATRRMAAAFWEAMRNLGYPGNGIRGTVMVVVRDTRAAANNPSHLFGQPVAQAVEREWKAHIARRGEAGRAREDDRSFARDRWNGDAHRELRPPSRPNTRKGTISWDDPSPSEERPGGRNV